MKERARPALDHLDSGGSPEGWLLFKEGCQEASCHPQDEAENGMVHGKVRVVRGHWMDVMWSDESNFELIRGTGKSLRRPYGSDLYHPTFTVKHPSPGSPFVPIFRILSQILDFVGNIPKLFQYSEFLGKCHEFCPKNKNIYIYY